LADLSASELNYTNLEQEVIAAIKAFEVERCSSAELMYCLDASGSRTIDISTGAREAPFSPRMKAEMAAGAELRFWHNHPSNDSLSADDWRAASVSANIEVVALTSKGSMFVGRVPDWDDQLEIVFKNIPQIAGFAQIELMKLEKSDPSRNASAIEHLVGHLINVELATRKLLSYAFDLSEVDRTALQDASAKADLAAVEHEIHSAFDQRLGHRQRA
jgi:hypothetical protein